jgi:hypothetical protein
MKWNYFKVAMLAISIRLPNVRVTPTHALFLRRLIWCALGVLVFHFPAFAQNPTTVASGPWDAQSTWASGIMPKNGDTVIIRANDSVWLDHSTPSLNKLYVNGTLVMTRDTLLLTGNLLPFDTAVYVRGMLDVGGAWFHSSNLLSSRALVHVFPSALFRTGVSFPIDTIAMFDSLSSPLFILDSLSTFEYYSGLGDITDVTYLANNIIGGAYQKLSLTNITASFRANPITIKDTLRVGFGTTVNTNARTGSTNGLPTQQITIRGDVINENKGESGAAGAGSGGCGFLSTNTDVWIFDHAITGKKDTCYWSGPSQLGTVIVKPNTVLAVRYYSDTVCDSLDIINRLIEEGMPCGGHVIGKVFSEIAPILSAQNPIDSFFGLGITIRSGSAPYLGPTRIVRTSGYLPSNMRREDHPVLRYLSISTGDGPQYGSPNEISIQIHCDEMNGASPEALHFWRSRDRGARWAHSGITSYDPVLNIFRWDTTTLAAPNDSGTFYWTLSEGYTDIPLPLTIERFDARNENGDVLLSWNMISELGIAGYEVERTTYERSEIIQSYQSNNDLVVQSHSGLSYQASDHISDGGPIRYDLFEVTKDGFRRWLASRTVEIREGDQAPLAMECSGRSLRITGKIEGPTRLVISDLLGRTVLSQEIGSPQDLPIQLNSGTYIARLGSPGNRISVKFVAAVP